ncbi:MAG: uroporphyrinogen decarboxylase [Porticoccaceae bacterium]|nr:MAG: uroporphyrinogen decarboxylase [Porticoccaceae bacterium]
MGAGASPLANDRLLRALRRQPVDVTPVWIMRQAGRYLPEYRRVRAAAGDFMTLCRDPALACEVTLQPLKRFDLDAAILFSDILTVPDAMGFGLYFVEGEGPRFRVRPETPADLARLQAVRAAEQLDYVLEAVRLIRRELDGRLPLIGFSGSPWTLATYILEGGASRDFARAKRWLYQEPAALHHLLDLLAHSVADYLRAQIAAGVDAVQIFDTWGGVLAHDAYRTFSLAYMVRVVEALRAPDGALPVPVILFTKGGGVWLEEIAASGASAAGLDWTLSLGEARRRTGDRIALQGNLDPAVLRADPATIEREVARVLADYGPGPGHVFNLGHGVTPDVDPDRVALLVDKVHELSEAYHR